MELVISVNEAVDACAGSCLPRRLKCVQFAQLEQGVPDAPATDALDWHGQLAAFRQAQLSRRSQWRSPSLSTSWPLSARHPSGCGRLTASFGVASARRRRGLRAQNTDDSGSIHCTCQLHRVACHRHSRAHRPTWNSPLRRHHLSRCSTPCGRI